MALRYISPKQVAIGLILLFSGCASPPPSADYGAFPAAYEESTRMQITEKLIDPESARFRIGMPVKAYMNNGLLYGGDVGVVGYVVPVGVNAKNRYLLNPGR